MKFSTHKRRRTPTVIIVSLIDVLLVVLIFLMVSTTFKRDPTPALRLTLPESKTAQAGATKDAKPVVILIGTNFPFFYYDNKPVTADRLQLELTGAVLRNPQTKVTLKADRSAPWGEVVRVLDAAKLANVRPDSLNIYMEKSARR